MLKHITSSPSRRRTEANGFTLVELLVVIVILGILAAVVVFAVTGISKRSRDNSCKNEGRTFKTSMEAFNADLGRYPASLGELTNGVVVDGVNQGKYLDKGPKYWSFGAQGNIARTDTATVSATDCEDVYT